MKKTVHFLKKCGVEECGGHVVCGHKADRGLYSIFNYDEILPKTVTLKRSNVTCGNCKRTKAFRNRGKKQ